MAGPKMLATLPKGDGNGLVTIINDLINDSKALRVVIAIVDCNKVTRDTDTEEQIPTVRVRRIEVIADRDDMVIAETLMRRALERRTSGDSLPFDVERDIEEAFGQ
jgi:hypothetical protein